MRTILFIILLLPLMSMAQKVQTVAVRNFKTAGFVNNVRLDSIDAVYAQLERTINGDRFLTGYTFVFGQLYTKEKDVSVTNDKGEVLLFTTTAGALNFFDYNGWQLLEAYLVGTDQQTLLLKKK